MGIEIKIPGNPGEMESIFLPTRETILRYFRTVITELLRSLDRGLPR
jgi:hypothetical protein